VIDSGKGLGFQLYPRLGGYLADNDGLEITVDPGETPIGLGTRARRLLEKATAAVT
jgi:hypothetical protein